MMAARHCLLSLVLLSGSLQVASVNPVQKVVQLLSELEAKVRAAGEAEEKAFKEYSEWCEDAARNAGFEIKTATAEKEKLEAVIGKAAADGEGAKAHIEDLAKAIQVNEGDLQAATQIREKEHSEFAASEAELVDAIDTLDRAIAILEREMQKNPALLQKTIDTHNFQGLVSALNVVIDAASFSSVDKQKLLALMQNKQSDDDQDSDYGAPAPDAYKSHSSNIVDVLEDLKEKAEGQLADERKAETNSRHNFEMLKQSLEDQMAADTKDMDEAKASKAAAAETKSIAEGDLALTDKDLKNAQQALAATSTSCMSAAQDHETSKKVRAEELAALKKAQEIMSATSSGAESQSYSLLQTVSSGASQLTLASRQRLVNLEVVTMVKKLAKEQHSTQLAQLASRISTVLKYSAADGEDPFAKVKGLIEELIERLVAEAGAEASQKAYCDEETKKNEEKKDELSSDIDALTTKLDQAAARSANLKEQVAELQRELAELARTQAEMDAARKAENAAFLEAKTDLTLGVSGVQQAIQVLRDYYGSSDAFVQQPEAPSTHDSSTGAGNSIIGILEVIASDFSKNLAQEEVADQEAQEQYDKTTQENKITKTVKDQDVKYKTQEAKGLDKAISELSSDRASAQTELDAVLQYGEKLRDMCVAKAESYEERKGRREAEIAGLKEALAILEGESIGAFLQKKRGGNAKHV